MKRRFILLAVATFLSGTLMAAWDGSTKTAPSAGDGSESNPYQIKTEANLAWLANNISEWGKHFVQTADLDLGNHEWKPIGNSSAKFTGSYDGDGYVINNLYYNDYSKDYVGLFGYVNNGHLSNIIVASGFVYGYQNAAGVCGALNGGTIDCCANNATVYGKMERISGICGQAMGTVSISNCINYGLISGFNFTGGIVGLSTSKDASISYCINVGQVFGMRHTCGNLIGFNNNSFVPSHCYYDNQINASVGLSKNNNVIETDTDQTDAIEGKSTSELTNGSELSGFAPETWSFEEGLYPRLKKGMGCDAIILAATPVFLESGDMVDNVKKDFKVSVANSVSWTGDQNISISGNSASILKSTGTVITGTKGGYTKKVYLKTNKSGATEIGSENAPLTIESEEDLVKFRTAVNTYGTYKGCAAYDGFKGIHFKVTVDIALSNWTEPIGIHNSFKGIFDGNHRTISGINTNQPGISVVGGLFGCASYGEIKNITVSSNDEQKVNGFQFVGGLCGSTYYETLTNCISYCKVDIGSGKYAGGIVGTDKGYSTFIGCENHGSISSADCIGGILGTSNMNSKFSKCVNYGTITCSTQKAGGICGNVADNCEFEDCINQGSVTATNMSVGGIVGETATVNSLPIKNCINAGTISGKEHSGGIGGQIIGKATIESCLNIGLISSSSSNAGGIAGLIKSGVIVQQSFNSGSIECPDNKDGGGIIGSSSTSDALHSCINIGNVTTGKAITSGGATITKCFSDIQLSNANTHADEKKTTAEMTGTALSTLGSDWTYTDNMYPMIKTLENSEYMIMAATTIVLDAADELNDVNTKFHISTPHAVEWECAPVSVVAFSGNNAYISKTTSDQPAVVTAHLGKLEKTFNLTIKEGETLLQPDIVWDIPQTDFTYGDKLTTAMQNATESHGYEGHFEFNFDENHALSVGGHNLTATFIPNDEAQIAIKVASNAITVSKAKPTINWNVENGLKIDYGTDADEILKTATATLNGVDVSDEGEFFYQIPALTGGSKEIKVKFIGDNYESDEVTRNIIVTPATPAIAWAEPAAIDYGTALSDLQLGAVSGVEGTFTYYEVIDNNDVALPDDGILNAGTHTLKAVFDANSENYADGESMTVQLVVNKLKPVITWEPETAFAELNYGETLEENAFYASVPDEFNGKGNIVYLENDAVIDIYSIINAGTHTITAKFEPSDANYDTNTSTATIKVNKADPNVQWGDIEAITYGEKLSETQLNASSAAEGVEFSYTVTIGENTVPAMNAVLPAGDRVINAVLAESDNYNGWTGYKTIKVNAADLDIDWNPQGFTYGATAEEMASAVETAEISFNEQSLTEDDGTFIYTYPTPLNAGDNQSVSVKFVPNSTNFNNAEDTKLINIAKATPEIVWVPQNVTYGASSEEIAGALENAEAKFNGVSVNGDYEYTLPLTTDLQVGLAEGDIIAVVTFTPTDDDAVNFSEVSATVNVVVDKADPTITWEPTVTEFTYGTELSDEQLNATTNADGEIVYTDGETTIAAGNILDAGTHTITATLAESANYNEATATVTITVNAAETEITWETPAPIAYGTPISEIELNATANVDGTFAYTLNGENAEGQTPGIGSYSIVATFTPESSNYSGATATITLSVVSSAAEITWATPAAITYGTALGDAQLNATSEIEGNFYYTPASGAILPAGDSTLSVIFVPDSPDYGRAVASVKLTVNKAELKVSVADTTVNIGDAMPEFKLVYTGFVNNENESNLSTAPTATCAATTAEAGVFDIVVSGGESDNYNITYTNGKLTVADASAAAPVITWAEPAAITYGTLISADILNATVNAEGTLTYSVNVGDTLKAGTHKLIATFVPVNNTLTQNEYFITDTVTLTVNKANLTVSVADATVNQGDDMPSFSLDYKGFVLGETIADLTFIPRAKCNATTDNAGTFDIIVSGGASDNYNFEYKNGKLTVNAKETAIADSEVKISVYPNPTADVLFVETESNADYICIYNMAGKLVLTEANVGKTRIDLTNEPQGTYFVKVGDKTIKVLKF